MIYQACHVTQNKSPIHSPISQRKEIKCSAVVTCSRFWQEAMHFSIASDLNNSAVSCCYGPMIGANKFLFSSIAALKFLIPLRSYANDRHFLTSWIHTRTKRRYFDILRVPLMHSRSSGSHHVVRT